MESTGRISRHTRLCDHRLRDIGWDTRIPDASKFLQWAFRELRRQTEYKTKAEGITGETVNPAYTSQRCSHTECDFTHFHLPVRVTTSQSNPAHSR
ncbi:zinc ribbon domain-containing protein [Halobellus rufus]|uniref:zinc ribbon domain-containing protein n=1 Tax=Halobellus rufus TaxID=1448860 RepID=UPI0009E0895D